MEEVLEIIIKPKETRGRKTIERTEEEKKQIKKEYRKRYDAKHNIKKTEIKGRPRKYEYETVKEARQIYRDVFYKRYIEKHKDKIQAILDDV